LNIFPAPANIHKSIYKDYYRKGRLFHYPPGVPDKGMSSAAFGVPAAVKFNSFMIWYNYVSVNTYEEDI